MKFGLYLKNKGILTAEQLVTAIEFQHSRLAPLGQLALEEGVLSARQVFKILHCQSGIPHERFGEVAVGMGMMSHLDLQRLLVIQWDRKPQLAEIFVKLRMLSQSRVNDELAAYRNSMERHNVVIKRCVAPSHHLEPCDEPTLDDEEMLAMIR